MSYSAKKIIKILKKNGFIFKRSKGSHQVYYNSELNKTIIIPLHANKDLPKGTYFAILKQAGLSKNK